MQKFALKLEKEDYSQFSLLMVGVGGIGCEVLKCLSKFTFRSLDIIDLDDIELSNLNRQFYFKPEHIGRSKAIVAAEVFGNLSPQLKITPHQNTIYSPTFNSKFYQKFDAVILALDNQEARSYVNKQCVRHGLPIFESGTFGFMGQAYPIFPKVTRCYDCFPRPVRQTGLQICTVRTSPTKPEHCLFWAKNVFNNVFDVSLTDDTFRIVECVKNKPIEEATEVFKMISVRVFSEHISEQKNSGSLKFGHLEDIPLEIIELSFGEFLARKDLEINKSINSDIESEKKPRELGDSLKNLMVSLFSVFAKLICQKSTSIFDKDDDLHVEFVKLLTNLRCFNFKIMSQTFEDVRSKIGQIIPAISSTNSLVAGLLAHELLKYLFKANELLRIEKNLKTKFESPVSLVENLEGDSRLVFLSFQNFESYVSNTNQLKLIKGHFVPPFEDCVVCQRDRVIVEVNFGMVTDCLKASFESKWGKDFSYFQNNRLLFESVSEEDEGMEMENEEEEKPDREEGEKDKSIGQMLRDSGLEEVETLLIWENVGDKEVRKRPLLVSLKNRADFEINEILYVQESAVSRFKVIWQLFLDLKSLFGQKKRKMVVEKVVDPNVSSFTIVDLSEGESRKSIQSVELSALKLLSNGKRICEFK